MAGSSSRILVVGAGLAGLATARALRLAGFRPDVVEKRPVPTVSPVGIYLPGNATCTLRLLGLGDPIRPLGVVISRHRIHDTHGQLRCEVDLTRLWAGVGQCRALPRAALHQVLLSGAGGEVRYGTEVTGLDIGRTSVAATFGDGTQTEYDLVIGADGQRSTVRVLAGLGAASHPVGQIVYRGVVTGGPRLTEWTSLVGRRASFAVLPLCAGRLYFYATETVRSAATGSPVDPVARLRELFSDYAGPVPAVLDAVGSGALLAAQTTLIARAEPGRWSRGRVALVGDATHLTVPSLSRGAALALEDALVLADSLRHGGAFGAALRGYERRRRPRTGWLLNRSRDTSRCQLLPSGQPV